MGQLGLYVDDFVLGGTRAFLNLTKLTLRRVPLIVWVGRTRPELA